MIFLGDFSFVRIFLKNYRVTMITTLDTSCSENTMVCQQGEGFCMHVFSSICNIYNLLSTLYSECQKIYLSGNADSGHFA